MPKQRTRIEPKTPSRNMVCMFCDSKTLPDYKNPDVLKRFLSDRGRIYSRGRSGVCSKHQRSLAREIKRARHLALLPFTGNL